MCPEPRVVDDPAILLVDILERHRLTLESGGDTCLPYNAQSLATLTHGLPKMDQAEFEMDEEKFRIYLRHLFPYDFALRTVLSEVHYQLQNEINTEGLVIDRLFGDPQFLEVTMEYVNHYYQYSRWSADVTELSERIKFQLQMPASVDYAVPHSMWGTEADGIDLKTGKMISDPKKRKLAFRRGVIAYVSSLINDGQGLWTDVTAGLGKLQD